MINSISGFIDRHLQLIRGLVLATGCFGVVLIARRYHFMRKYKNICEIPNEFIVKKVVLRGNVEKIEASGRFFIQHKPILSFGLTNGSPLLCFKLAGVELQNGWLYHLQELQDKNIKFQVLQKNEKDVKGVLFYKKGFLSKEICVNEELVRRGMAITRCNIISPPNSLLYQELMEKLLKVEIKADRKGKGIWAREKKDSFITRIFDWMKES